jgi:predicted ATPase
VEPPAADRTDVSKLPRVLTPLVGRERDVEALRRWLADPGARVITLVGPGGVGKTRLAIELAQAVANERAVRVFFVPMAAVADPGVAACVIAEALGVADVTAANLARRVQLACNEQSTLLVLDNFEHLLAAAGVVAELLSSASALRLLVTSRAPLHLRGEREFVVEPLALGSDAVGLAPDDLALVPAVRLFVERVRAVKPEFVITEHNGPVVVEICRRLDALPLALELAAPWMKTLTAEHLLVRLERDVLLPTAGPRDLPERQQTMNAAIAWSFQLLDADRQKAFRRLGALPGLFSIDAAAAMLAAPGYARAEPAVTLSAVAGLIDKSLLVRMDASVVNRPIYRMLETVRAYAARELETSGEAEYAREALARYCLCEAATASEQLVSPAQAEWLDRVHDDLENYRQVLAWLVARGRAADAITIAWGLTFFWLVRGHSNEGLSWFEAVLNMPAVPAAAESRALAGAALMRYAQGQLEAARGEITDALALAHSAGDVDMIVHAQELMARIEHAVGNPDAATQWFTQAIDGYRALGIPWGVGNALIGKALVALSTGERAEAERLLDQASSPVEHMAPWFAARALVLRAILAVQAEKADEAIRLLRDSLVRLRDLRDKYAFVHAMAPLAAAAVIKRKYAWAARILGASDVVAERAGAAVVPVAVQNLQREAERVVRAQLGPARWVRAYADGRSMSIEMLLHDLAGPIEGDE